MKTLFCLLLFSVSFVSCKRQTDDPPASSPAGVPKTNVISKLDEKGRPIETTVYATNGLVKRRTFFQTAADGQILSARAVDAEGKLKWTEQYSYGSTADHQLVEVRRLRPNGEIVAMRFLYSADGTRRRIVIRPDGTEVPETEQAAFLEE